MKRNTFFIISLVLFGALIIFYRPEILFSPYKDRESLPTQLFSAEKPFWRIENSSGFFELSSLKLVEEDKEKNFLLYEPLFKSFVQGNTQSSASSVSASLHLPEESLIMRNNVHLTVSETEDKIDLFTDSLSVNLKNKTYSSDNKVMVKNSSLNLISSGFSITTNSSGIGKEISFDNAHFVNNETENKFQGKADLIIYRSPSEILSMKGSAEVNINSSIITAEEIEFNFKTKKIISSKKSKIIKS